MKPEKLMDTLYYQLEPDNFNKIAEHEGTQMIQLDYKHRVPGILILSTNEKQFPTFGSLLEFAALLIDDEPAETIICDTDMDSFEVTPILDFEHGCYDLPENPLTYTNKDGFSRVTSYKEDTRYIALIIKPLDYHS